MKAYRLNHAVPGLPAGVVFIHDKKDSLLGSLTHGCLKLAWNNGDCQFGWCGGTHIFPGQLAKERKWFTRVPNKGRYT